MGTNAKMGMKRRFAALAFAAALGVGLASGCEDDKHDHDFVAGMGAICVDNETGNRLRIYVDGAEMQSVSAWKQRFFDLNPGLYRVVLDDDDAQRTWGGDIDVLDGRLTVLEARPAGSSGSDFVVWTYLD